MADARAESYSRVGFRCEACGDHIGPAEHGTPDPDAPTTSWLAIAQPVIEALWAQAGRGLALEADWCRH
jgi:hypothetical protein